MSEGNERDANQNAADTGLDAETDAQDATLSRFEAAAAKFAARFDAPASTAPATDVPASTAPTTDVPASTAPATDVPATDTQVAQSEPARLDAGGAGQSYRPRPPADFWQSVSSTKTASARRPASWEGRPVDPNGFWGQVGAGKPAGQSRAEQAPAKVEGGASDHARPTAAQANPAEQANPAAQGSSEAHRAPDVAAPAGAATRRSDSTTGAASGRAATQSPVRERRQTPFPTYEAHLASTARHAMGADDKNRASGEGVHSSAQQKPAPQQPTKPRVAEGQSASRSEALEDTQPIRGRIRRPRASRVALSRATQTAPMGPARPVVAEASEPAVGGASLRAVVATQPLVGGTSLRATDSSAKAEGDDSLKSAPAVGGQSLIGAPLNPETSDRARTHATDSGVPRSTRARTGGHAAGRGASQQARRQFTAVTPAQALLARHGRALRRAGTGLAAVALLLLGWGLGTVTRTTSDTQGTPHAGAPSQVPAPVIVEGSGPAVRQTVQAVEAAAAVQTGAPRPAPTVVEQVEPAVPAPSPARASAADSGATARPVARPEPADVTNGLQNGPAPGMAPKRRVSAESGMASEQGRPSASATARRTPPVGRARTSRPAAVRPGTSETGGATGRARPGAPTDEDGEATPRRRRQRPAPFITDNPY